MLRGCVVTSTSAAVTSAVITITTATSTTDCRVELGKAVRVSACAVSLELLKMMEAQRRV